MPQAPSELSFSPQGIFYPMVTSANVAVAAATPWFQTDQFPKGAADFDASPNIGLPAVKTGPNLQFEPKNIHEAIAKGFFPEGMFFGAICMMLANTAYEVVKGRNDKSPEFELFRHIRNASSHGNRFYFEGKEPRRPATWRGATINHEQKGGENPLQGQLCFGGEEFFGMADLLRLLWDIEQKLLSGS